MLFGNTISRLELVESRPGYEVYGYLLTEKEQAIVQYQAAKKNVLVFTSTRIICTEVGSKLDFLSIPYSKISAFSFRTSSSFTSASDLTVWVPDAGVLTFQFVSGVDGAKGAKQLALKIN